MTFSNVNNYLLNNLDSQTLVTSQLIVEHTDRHTLTQQINAINNSNNNKERLLSGLHCYRSDHTRTLFDVDRDLLPQKQLKQIKSYNNNYNNNNINNKQTKMKINETKNNNIQTKNNLKNKINNQTNNQSNFDSNFDSINNEISFIETKLSQKDILTDSESDDEQTYLQNICPTNQTIDNLFTLKLLNVSQTVNTNNNKKNIKKDNLMENSMKKDNKNNKNEINSNELLKYKSYNLNKIQIINDLKYNININNNYFNNKNEKYNNYLKFYEK